MLIQTKSCFIQRHKLSTVALTQFKKALSSFVATCSASRNQLQTAFNSIGTRKCKTLWWRAWASSDMHMNEMMSWIASVYECHLCTTLTWSDLNLAFIICTVYEQPAVDAGLVHSCCDKQEVRCRACFNLRRLCFGYRCCTLAVAQHCPSPIEAQGHSTFLNTHLVLMTSSKLYFNLVVVVSIATVSGVIYACSEESVLVLSSQIAGDRLAPFEEFS